MEWPAWVTSLRSAVVLVIGTAMGIVGFVLVADIAPRDRPSVAGGARHDDRPTGSALELVALEHDRDDDRLVVRGIVRNPSSGQTQQNLTAVVLMFAKDGAYISSGQAPLAVRSLRPGAETPFVVALPDANSVDRYRVSFRTDERIVPHIDRRSRSALARRE